MNRAWHPITADFPPRGTFVRLKWSGRQPVAMKTVHPRTRLWCWLTKDGNSDVYLPDRSPPPDPRRPWAGWHTLSRDGPEAWQPLDARTWTGPLPEPLYVVGPEAAAGRMVSIGMKFREVEAAELEDMTAEEMAAERAAMLHEADARSRTEDSPHGRPGCSVGNRRAKEESQWWTDPNAVTYSGPGSISRREAEGRLMRAFNTERWVTADRPGDPTFSRLLAMSIKPEPLTPGEAAALDPPPVRLEPTPADIRDYATAREWTKALAYRTTWNVAAGKVITPDALLSYVSLVPALGWRAIGRRLGMSHEAARKQYARDLEAITAAANGLATDGTRLVAAELERVRTANRQTRRGG